MAETYSKYAFDDGQTTVSVNDLVWAGGDIGAILCEIDAPTPDGAILVLRLHRFSDESGWVQVNRKRAGDQSSSLWIDADNLPEVIDALQKAAVAWAHVGKDGRTSSRATSSSRRSCSR